MNASGVRLDFVIAAHLAGVVGSEESAVVAIHPATQLEKSKMSEFSR